MAYWGFYWKGKYLLLMFILLHKLLFSLAWYSSTLYCTIWPTFCKGYAKLRNISFRSISSRFAPRRSANYSKPRAITIHEVWKGGGGLHGAHWRRLSLICQMGRTLFRNIFLPLLNYSLIFVHWPVQCNISPRRVFHQSPTFRFFSWFELRTNKWPFHRSTVQRQPVQYFSL